jgi:hypothetical protein
VVHICFGWFRVVSGTYIRVLSAGFGWYIFVSGGFGYFRVL